MNIENLITKKNRLDRRYKLIVELERWFNKYTLASAMWSLIITSTAWCYLSDRTSLQPLKQTIIPKVEEVKAIELKRFCDDPISYIRCRGQQLGIDDYTITKIIHMIITCENKSLNPEAININTDKHKSMDVGIMQINMYWHRNEVKLVDMLDFKKNIDYGYKLFLDQGFTPWSCAHKLGYI